MNAQATIVVLEDEHPQLMLLQASLQEAGEVAAFADPVAALDFLRNQPVDVALIDVGLGAHAKMDGLEFIRAVKEFESGDFFRYFDERKIEIYGFRADLKQSLFVDLFADIRLDHFKSDLRFGFFGKSLPEICRKTRDLFGKIEPFVVGLSV
jgi:CheY-like chemotaxis protein